MGLQISDDKFQEVADYFNRNFDALFTKEQIKNADLPSQLLLEIDEGGYQDTCQYELIIDHLAEKYIGLKWPCYGDSDKEREQFRITAKEKGILKKT